MITKAKTLQITTTKQRTPNTNKPLFHIRMESPTQEINNPNDLLRKPFVRTFEASGDDFESVDDSGSSESAEEDMPDNLREVAKQLLKKEKAPIVQVVYKNLTFDLFKSDNESADECDLHLYLFEEPSVLDENGKEFFAQFRRALNELAPSANLDSNEIYINVPALDITFNEDNYYNQSIGFRDVITLFDSIKENSLKANSNRQYSNLVFNIELKPRFFVRFNELVEAMNNSGTFDQIMKFSNDEDHPLVLDDDNEENEGSGDSDVEVISV